MSGKKWEEAGQGLREAHGTLASVEGWNGDLGR